MATTVPDGIWTPDDSTAYNLPVDLAAMADTVQSALDAVRSERSGFNQQFYGPAADRASLTDVKPGDTYQESDSNKMQWEQTAGGLWRVLNSNREIDLTLASGWNSGAQSARFEVRNGYLSFNGRISGSAGAGEVITTLPVDYRPSRERAMSFFDMTTIRDLVLGADGALRNHGKGSASVVDLRLATVAPFPIK